MTRTPLVALGVKEVRALAPLWAACVAATAAHGVVPGSLVSTTAVLAYGFGSIALGAQSIGHEYGYGTLGTLLAQPVDRRRILIVKQAVLAALLGALGLVASQTVLDSGFRGPSTRVAVLIGFGGLFVAPAFTMLARSWIAGAVFTITISGLFWVALVLVGAEWYGTHYPRAIDAFVETVYWPSMYAICAAGAVASWALFVRLQDIEGGGRPIELSQWFRREARPRAPAASPRGATWQLVVKELHIYQMPIVLAVLYAVGILALTVPDTLEMRRMRDIAGPGTILYVGGVTALIGSLVSAEERQLGTLEWQLLVPVSVRRQWTVKIVVSLVLVAALALGLPAALGAIAPGVLALMGNLDVVVPLLLLTYAVGVYVSSLSTGGIRALLVTFPALLVASAAVRWFLDWGYRALYNAKYVSVFRIAHANPTYHKVLPWIYVAAVVGIIAGALIVFGYRNHRSAERPWQRVVLQVVLLAAIVALTLTAGMVLGV